MRSPYDINALNLSALSQHERELVEKTREKPSIAGTTGILVVAIQTFNLILACRANPENITYFLGAWAGVNVVYISLSIWARTWSMPAIALLLGWHILSYWRFSFGVGAGLMMLFWWPALSYLLALATTRTRNNAVRKAQPIVSTPNMEIASDQQQGDQDAPSNR